jgi:hypothetical protein
VGARLIPQETVDIAGAAYRALLQEFGQITMMPHREMFEITEPAARLKVDG